MLFFFKTQRKWLLPLLFLLLIAPFTPVLDMKIAHFFYKEGAFASHPFYTFMFRYGERIGLTMWGLTVALLPASYLLPAYKRFRRPLCLMVLTTLIGAGILTNLVCKNCLGRPRPKQLVEFGGTLTYRPFWQPNLDPARPAQKSLPSGHVAMGWSYVGWILAGRQIRSLRPIGVGLVLFWGVGLMLTRVAQGGHFLSDVLIAACLMWWTALIIRNLLHRLDGSGREMRKESMTEG